MKCNKRYSLMFSDECNIFFLYIWWFGVVRFGLDLFDLIWFGLVWIVWLVGFVWFGLIWFGVFGLVIN